MVQLRRGSLWSSYGAPDIFYSVSVFFLDLWVQGGLFNAATSGLWDPRLGVRLGPMVLGGPSINIVIL